MSLWTIRCTSTWVKQLDAFLDEAKRDISSMQYYFNDEPLDKEKPLMVNNTMISGQFREPDIETRELDPERLYKLIRVRFDLCVYFARGRLLREVLQDACVDFERTFFCRAEADPLNEFLPKRVYFSHNEVSYSIYFAEEEKFKVG